MLKEMVKKAEVRVVEQEDKVNKMDSQVKSMRKTLEQAQGALNNEVVELAVRQRLVETLKEAVTEQAKEETDGTEVLDNDRGPTGPEHSDKIRRLDPDRGDDEATTPHTE